MAQQPRETLPNRLPAVFRFITTHDQSGKAVYSDAIAEESKWQDIGGGQANFALNYSTRQFPVDMNASEPANSLSVPKDIQSYEKDLNSPPGLSIQGGTSTESLVSSKRLLTSLGTVCRFVDFAPHSESSMHFMHRTESLDYGVVLEGSMELELDSGEKRIMHRGDVIIQRATNHAWKNVSGAGVWARMLFVLVAAEKVVVGDKILGEEVPEIDGLEGGEKK